LISWLLVPIACCAWLLAAGGVSVALGRRPEGDERHPVVTDDGWTLTLHRIPPAHGVPRRSEPPIILGHGLMMNAACWSLSPGGSLPRRLSKLGFDVWIAEYRSTDSALAPPGDDTPGRWDYDVDDIASSDLPAIIAAVQELSGSSKVSWVGHSMGGIVLYRYAALHGCGALHRVVTLGTPVRYEHLRDILPWGMIPRLAPALPRLRSTSVRLATRLGLPAVALHPRPFAHFSGNFDNHTRREQLVLAHHALQDNATRIPSWFLDRMDSGETQATSAVTVPLLVLGGLRDRLAPPTAVHAAFDDASGGVDGVKVYGERDGEPHFGHSDLISSEGAVAVVVPDLVEWLSGAEPTLIAGRVKRHPASASPMET
jgi:pimeloyl-ACP methyl ester carboxylesterase